MPRQQFIEFRNEDAAKTVYRSEPETMTLRLLSLGLVIDYILKNAGEDDFPLLRRVFDEQYEKDENGTVKVHDKKRVSSKSLQNSNDPDALYRSKGKQKVKGYSSNITETTDEEGKPCLITNIQVKGATAADNGYVEDAVKNTEEVTDNKVETLYADGAYQSEENWELTDDKGNSFRLMTGGLQGKPGHFELNRIDESTLEVTDRITSETITATSTRNPEQCKVKLKGKDELIHWRYFGKKELEKAKIRREIESTPPEEKMKRNNVEATIFQYCVHTRNNKTRYRGLLKHKRQAFTRGL